MLFPETYFEACETEINDQSTAPMYTRIETWDFQNLTEYQLWSDNDQIQHFRAMSGELDLSEYRKDDYKYYLYQENYATWNNENCPDMRP